MNEIADILKHPHSVIILYVAFWFSSACISNLPAPNEKSGAFYTWFYKTAQMVCASLKQVNLQQVIKPTVAMPPAEIEKK